MSNNDIAIGMSTRNLNSPPVSLKPSYLIYLNDKNNNLFVALDKLDMQSNCVLVKGFFCSESENIISSGFNEIINSVKKENIVEIYFPWHKINKIKNLVFKSK